MNSKHKQALEELKNWCKKWNALISTRYYDDYSIVDIGNTEYRIFDLSEHLDLGELGDGE